MSKFKEAVLRMSFCEKTALSKLYKPVESIYHIMATLEDMFQNGSDFKMANKKTFFKQ